jgi:hypothetical protein
VGFGRKAIVAYLYEPSCAFRLWLLLDYLCVETTLRWGVQGLVGVTTAQDVGTTNFVSGTKSHGTALFRHG